MSTHAIVTENLTKEFRQGRDGVRALEEVSFRVSPGETVALMGDNGAGKSTLLDLVCGLTTPTSGLMEVLGQPPRAAVRDGRVAAMLQTGGLLPDLTVAETVTLVASLFDRPGEVDRALQAAGLARIADRRIAACSGGEQQRVKFALAMLPDAALLVLDEPTAGMDWHARAQFWEHMRALAERGRTLVYATHYADEVLDVADRVLVLSRGRLVADDALEAIVGTTRQRLVRCTVPAGFDVAALRQMPGVRSASGREKSGRDTDLEVTVAATQTNEVVAFLLGEESLRDLRVEDPPLFASLDAVVRGDRGVR